jgi:hypothetical protein
LLFLARPSWLFVFFSAKMAPPWLVTLKMLVGYGHIPPACILRQGSKNNSLQGGSAFFKANPLSRCHNAMRKMSLLFSPKGT